jgi:hypothetical protein
MKKSAKAEADAFKAKAPIQDEPGENKRMKGKNSQSDTDEGNNDEGFEDLEKNIQDEPGEKKKKKK